uniref:Uncharacterized protein n=1 Tax=Avena sativa TaxID=4498 RepID=A0ACD5UVI3_AVESA
MHLGFTETIQRETQGLSPLWRLARRPPDLLLLRSIPPSSAGLLLSGQARGLLLHLAPPFPSREPSSTMADPAANEDGGHGEAYDPMKDPDRRPRRSSDPGWNYAYYYKPPNLSVVVCNLCGKITSGGIKRQKEHLAGTGGDATGCQMASRQLRREMLEYLEKNRRNNTLPDDDDVVEVDGTGETIPVTSIPEETIHYPLDWWGSYGGRAIDLQRFAKRIVSLCASSSGCERNWSTFEFIHTKKRNRLQHRILNDNVFVSYNRKNLDRFQKRKEKIGDKSFDPLVIDDFDWGNEWVDPTIPPPQGARGCPDDISWDLVDEAVGASSSMRGRYFPRATTTTMQRGPSTVNVPYQRQRKRAAPSPLESDHEFDDSDVPNGEDDEGQHSTIPNGEGDDSDVQDDVDVTDDEDPSSEQDGEGNANAIVDEFDDGYE